MEMCGFGVGALHTYGYEWDRGVGRTDGASRSEKLGRGGTVSEISETSYCHPAGANPA